MELSPGQPVVAGWGVHDRGVTVPPDRTGVVDICFDGRRVWSIDPVRDRDPDGVVPWMPALQRRLHGSTSWSLRDPTSGEVLAAGNVRLGNSDEPLRLVDDEGFHVAIGKQDALERVFEDQGDHVRGQVTDALIRALADLRDRGSAEAFLNFGCLLGAVRDGRLIGHDTDADLTVLCPSPYPVDVQRQSFRLERLMASLGWRSRRMSGRFVVSAELADGSQVNIDVFSAWHDLDGTFHLLPCVRGELDRSALIPVGSVLLEGRDVVAPARPEALLETIYGPDWAVPDPSFRYHPPRAISRRMSGWFRAHRRVWTRWSDHDEQPGAWRSGPSDFALWAAGRLSEDAALFEMGCGTGRDAVYFAGLGRDVVAGDHSSTALELTSRAAAEAGVPVAVELWDAYEVRGLLHRGALMAFEERTYDLYGRFLLEWLHPSWYGDLWRFASMVQRKGGRTFLEFRTRPGGDLGPVDANVVVAGIEDRGGSVDVRIDSRGLEAEGDDDTTVTRLVVTWRRSR